jgi:transcription termination factor Rho
MADPEPERDVVIILDSITRLGRAYNTLEGGGGRTMSGGLDSNALEKPKRFLGSARKIAPNQGGGSLTIIATALVDTGSRMDQVIFEEFKGTGNSELVLNRELADRRVYPAIDLQGSATRKEELLLDEDSLWLSRAMRRQLAGGDPPAQMVELLNAMRKTKTNRELIDFVQSTMGSRSRCRRARSPPAAPASRYGSMGCARGSARHVATPGPGDRRGRWLRCSRRGQ